MAAPNLINSTTITGKTALSQLTTAIGNIVTNAAASNTVNKVNSITLANYSATATNGNVIINRSSTEFYLAGNVVIPAFSTLIVVGKDNQLYLEEGDVIQANVSANSSVSMSVSYENIA
jgi:hypothetical protein